MPNDRNGNPIVADAIYSVAGTVRAVEGDSVLVVFGDQGQAAMRVKAADLVPIEHAAGGPFAPLDGSQAFTSPPSSAVAASLPQHLVRIGEVNALFNALTATFLGYLANKSDVGHTHSADAVSVSDGDWSGALVGSGVKNVQDLADWIDANVTGGG
jgi:hypothetical protein